MQATSLRGASFYTTTWHDSENKESHSVDKWSKREYMYCMHSLPLEIFSVSDPYPDWIRIQSGQGIRIRIRIAKRAKMTHKNRKKL